jgi:hypothetical protein
MHSVILVAVLCAAPQLPAGVATSIDKQPVPLDMRAVAGEPLRPASGWALTPTGDLPADGVVTAQGLGVRIRSASDVMLFRPEWTLTGSFAVGALFQSSQSDAIYGVTLGGARGLAFLVRNNGTFAIASKSAASATGATWIPVQLRAVTDRDASAANRLEVRAGATEVRFVINGQTVRTMPIAAGQLDGSLGVYVGAACDVNVAGFTIEGAAFPQPRMVK